MFVREETRKITGLPVHIMCGSMRQRVCFELKCRVEDISHRSVVLCKIDLRLAREVFII